MYKHKALFVIKVALVLTLGYAVIRTVLMPQHTGEIFAPDSARSAENMTAVEPASLPDTPVEDYSAIVEQDIFGNPASSLRTSKSLRGNGVGMMLSAGEELGIALLGTVAGSREISRAIIKVVVLLHQGQRKILDLGTRESKRRDADNAQAASSTNATHAVETNPSAKSHTTAGLKPSDIEIMLTKAVIEPYVIDGQVEGLRITGLENMGGAKELGFKNGDVIRAVDGHRVTSKQKAYQIFKKAKSQATTNIELLRDNEAKTLSFSLR